MAYCTFKACRSGLQAIPKKSMKLDLVKLAGKFENVKAKTKVILVVEIDGIRASIYPSGRVLIHDCSDDRAQEVAACIYRKIGGMGVKP